MEIYSKRDLTFPFEAQVQVQVQVQIIKVLLRLNRSPSRSSNVENKVTDE